MRPMELDNLKMIVVHCSATRPDQDIGVETIRQWHKSRGFSDIGYHYVINRRGCVEAGRALKHQGAHTKGHNNSIGICLLGGIKHYHGSDFNFTCHQLTTLKKLCYKLINKVYKKPLKIVGHRDLDDRKDCPCFDVQAFFNHRCLFEK